MASRGTGEYNGLDGPNWRMQGRGRAQTAESSLSRGGFAAWTDVPPVGVPDLQLAEQNRAGRVHYPGKPGYAKEADPSGGGKRVPAAPVPRDRAEGKRIFSSVAQPGAVPTAAEMRPGGLKRVHAAGKPATANPNARPDGEKAYVRKPEGVYINPAGRNDVRYQCWRPNQLNMAYGGDWNLNSRYGVRKVTRLPDGVPKRMMETPVAWPSYAGYPPDRDPRSNKWIDYALAANGGTLSLKPEKHPDVRRSHENRLAASNPPASYSSYRHAGEWYY